MSDLDRLLKERAAALQAEQNQRHAEEQQKALQLAREKQAREDEKRNKVQQIGIEYQAIQEIIARTGIDQALQRILKFANDNKSYRGRDLNIPSKLIPRPQYRRDQGGYPKNDYARMVDKPFLYPRSLKAGQVIDDATRLTLSPDNDLRRIQRDPGNHLWSSMEWVSMVYWVVYDGVHGYSVATGNNSSSYRTYTHIFEEGLIVTINHKMLEIAQYQNSGNGNMKEKTVTFHNEAMRDTASINTTLADAYAGTIAN
jgi:hypothetical protein